MRLFSYLARLAVMATFALISIAAMAIAQTADSSVIDRQSFLYEIWTVIQPIAMLLVTTVGPLIVAWIAYQVTRLLNITDEKQKLEVEAQVRNAVHTAALNALKVIAAKYGGLPSKLDIGDAVVEEAISYVRGKNPDTSAGINDLDLSEIILSKVLEVKSLTADTKAPPAPRKR